MRCFLLLLVVIAMICAANLHAQELPPVHPLVAGGDHSGEDHSGHDHSGESLAGINLYRANLESADFSNADLSEANLKEANAIRADFINANLRRAVVSNGHLLGTDFRNADLRDSDLSNSKMIGSSFFDADLGNAILRASSLERSSLVGTNLGGVIFPNRLSDIENARYSVDTIFPDPLSDEIAALIATLPLATVISRSTTLVTKNGEFGDHPVFEIIDGVTPTVVDIPTDANVDAIYVHDGVSVNAHGDLGIVSLSDSSSMVIFSGEVAQPSLYDESVVTVVGGTPAARFYVFDSSTLNIAGGEIGRNERAGRQPPILALGSSTVNISGGRIATGDSWRIRDVTIGAIDESSINISGGEMNSLSLRGSSTTVISGGTILGNINAEADALVNMTGGFVGGDIYSGIDDRDRSLTFSIVNLKGGQVEGDLFAKDGGTLNIFGHDFNHALGPIGDGEGLLTGVLSDGTPISSNFLIHGEGSAIVLIPEPSTFALLLIGLIGVACRRRD